MTNVFLVIHVLLAVALIGIVLTVMGVLEHLRYRRLERRLAALKGRV